MWSELKKGKRPKKKKKEAISKYDPNVKTLKSKRQMGRPTLRINQSIFLQRDPSLVVET
jgi:hypothetical protein